MKLLGFAALLAFLFVPNSAYCKGKGHLYNVRTGEVVDVQFTRGVFSGHGKIWAKFHTGEQLTGEYSVVREGGSSWGSIYGASGSQVFSGNGYSSWTSRAVRGSAMLTGDKKVLSCEFITSGLHGTGACQDQNRDLFNLIF